MSVRKLRAKRLLDMRNFPPLTAQVLQNWFSTPGGQQLLIQETGHVRAVLPALIGCRLLQVGSWALDEDLFRNGAMLQHWILGLADGPGIHARMDGKTLPVASRSVDTVLLPHSLELVQSPHRLLREVDRVLCNHGHVIIQGFNPWGVWSLRQSLPWGKQRFPAGAHFYSLNRVRDWLELLDFEVLEVRRYGAGHAGQKQQTDIGGDLLRMFNAPLSQAYQLLARKRVIPLTPMRQRWSRSRVVAPTAVPEARVQRAR